MLQHCRTVAKGGIGDGNVLEVFSLPIAMGLGIATVVIWILMAASLLARIVRGKAFEAGKL